MSFVGRARSSFERGDTLRAVLTLVAGLRRSPKHVEALSLLVELVRDEVESGGIEHEIVQVLVPQPRRDALLTEMVIGLRDREENRIADRLIVEAERRGMSFVAPPEPEPDLGPESEPEAEPETASVRASEAEPEPEPDGESHSDSADDEDVAAATTSEERERRQRQTAEAEARLNQRKREAIAQRQAELAAKRRRRTVQVVVVALIVGIGFVGVYVAGAASRTADMTELEGAIQRFNRFDDESLAVVSKAAASRDEATFSERLSFARALSGESSNVELDAWETSWGLAAGVVSALQKDDVESALALVTKAERTEAGSLGAEYARALLEEHRGNSGEARDAASRVIDRYGAFAPAHEIMVRASARQLELEVTQAAVEQLGRIAPDHPYVELGTLPHAREVLLGPKPRAEEPADLATEDPFLRSFQSYRRAVAAASRGDYVAVAAHGKKALEADRRMLPARVLRATALVAVGSVDDAVAEYDRAAADARSAPVRLLIQATAPFALTGIGRPDLGKRFTTPYPKLRADGVDDRFDEELADTRPEALRKSAMTDVAVTPWAVEALFARAHLRAEQGDVAAAKAMYRDLETRNIAPARANAMLALLGEPTASERDAITVTVRDFVAGRFQSPAVKTEVPAWALRLEADLRARSLLAIDRTGEALRVLDRSRAGLAHEAALETVRLLAASHLGRKNARFLELSGRLATESTAVGHSLRVAEAFFWQRQFTEAEAWIDRAEKIDSSQTGVAWVCALVKIGRSRGEEAAECLEKTGMAVSETAGVQIALGFVQLELGRPKQATTHFETALELAPGSADAARGLGEALVDEMGRRSKNAIDEAAGPLEPRAVAELQRWAAVAMGSRKGSEEALPRLDAALGVLGERADLNVELARYHAAREDWGRAEQLYESALRLDDSIADAHLAVARIKLRGDGPSGARQHLKRFLDLEPQSASAAWARQQLE